MLATRSLLQKLAVTVVLSSNMAVLAASATSFGMSMVTHSPPITISNEPPRRCLGEIASILIPIYGPVGELHTTLRSASITYGLVPSVPCSVLAVVPSLLQDDFADFETSWYDWWQTRRSNFTSWRSTCSGQYTGHYSTIVSDLLNATSSMDNFTPRVTDCAESTRSGTEMTSTGDTASPGGPTRTGAGGVAETASAGQNGGGWFRLQHTAAICVVMVTFARTTAVI